MGQIQRFTDATGDMSMVDRQDQDIDQIMGEVNRQADQLDSLNKSTKVIAQDSVTVTIPTGQTYAEQTYTYGSGTVGSFLCSIVRSDDTTHSWPIPYFETAVNGSGTLDVKLIANASASANVITFSVRVGSSYTTPPSVTFNFQILEQPANTGN